MNAYACENCKTNLPATMANKDMQPLVSVSRTQTHAGLFYIQASTSCLHWARCKWARARRPHASRVTMAASPRGLMGGDVKPTSLLPSTSLQLPWGLWHYVISWHRGPKVYLLIAKSFWTGPIGASESPSDWSGRWENNKHWAAFGGNSESTACSVTMQAFSLWLLTTVKLNGCRGV